MVGKQKGTQPGQCDYSENALAVIAEHKTKLSKEDKCTNEHK